ncbi:MAG: EF-P lysine aminoacylase EpmA [Acidiferrobacteraceae bacterium]
MRNAAWRPAASLAVLRLRARLLARTRAYFEEAGVLEVETPVLSGSGTTDPRLVSLVTRTAQGIRYLHTSPEFPMKRLLAAGSESIYQICHVFRDNEAGRVHNPEFTLVEWYRTHQDHWALMTGVEELLRALLGNRLPEKPAERISYRDAFLTYAGIDPHVANVAEFTRCARSHGIHIDLESDIDAWRDLVLTHVVEPNLGRDALTFLYGYPASQAALARVDPGPPPTARRFEVYLSGIELGNGFHELANAQEWRRRADLELASRKARGLPEIPLDTHLAAALEHGLPDCAGVAVGFDRIVMLAAGCDRLEDVLAFPADRA